MASSSNPPGTSVQEYSIRVPKNNKKTYKVMRFNSSVNVDFTKWSQVKMERENNLKEFKGDEEEAPKFGAGSEFGREAREEARRKKYGIISKKYRPEDQPWILKVGGKTGKKFRGTREGGVAENAAYYVFTHAPDGAIEAFPLQEWYNFQPTQRYKALSAEEAEQEFGRRNNQVNYFSLMMRKRLRGEKDDDLDEGEEFKVKGKSKARKGDLKISEMDDWIESSDSSESDEENKEKKEEEKPKKKKNVPVKKKKKRDPDDEAFEESDDGDEEGREVDYISDSSESASDHETKVTKELKGVEEEDALRKLLSSGEEDEEEEQKEEGEKEEESEEKTKGDLPVLTKDEKDKKSKKKSKDSSSKKKKDDSAGQNQDSSSDASSDTSDSDNDQKKKNSSKGAKETNSGASSRSATPTKDKSQSPAAATVENMKRKAASQESALAKKSRLDNFATAVVPPISGSGESGISEEAVRKYLMRKPMTTTELLQKFKTKKTGLSSDQLVNIMTHILKRIIPTKQTIKGKMYLSIKPQ